MTPGQGTSNMSQASYTVEELLERASDYLVSNTTVLFYPGLHQIQQPLGNILIQNVENLSLEGKIPTGVLIHCKNIFSLGFINVSHLSVTNLQFTGCTSEFSRETIDTVNAITELCDHGQHLWLQPCSDKLVLESSALTVVRGMHVFINNVQIRGAEDVGLLLLNIHFSLELSRLKLEDNGINCIIATLPPFRLNNSNDNWQADAYKIDNSAFRRGSTYKKFASGLNILHRELYKHIMINNIQNITAEDNFRGNIMLQVTEKLNIASILSICRCRLFLEIVGLTVADATNRLARTSGITITTTKPTAGTPWAPLKKQTIYECVQYQIKETKLIGTGIRIAFFAASFYEIAVTISALSLKAWEQLRPLTLVMINAQVNFSNLTADGNYKLGFFQCNLLVTGNNYFRKLRTSITLTSTNITFEGITLITDSSSTTRGILYLIASKVVFAGYTELSNNYASNSSSLVGRGNSKIFIVSNVLFSGNTGYNGGAIALYEGSRIIFYPSEKYYGMSVLRMVNNSAENYGGAIYIEDYITEGKVHRGEYVSTITCSILVHRYAEIPYTCIFENNTAKIAGNRVFGGWLDYCSSATTEHYDKLLLFPKINSTQTEYSSNAVRVCICKNNRANCRREDIWEELSPGEQLQISAIAVGQRFGVTPAIVRAKTESGLKVNDLELLQNIQTVCTPLVYTIQMVDTEYQDLQLLKRLTLIINNNIIPQHDPTDNLFEPLDFTINIKDCAKGYIYNSSTGVCRCDVTLLMNGLQCDLQRGTVERKKRKWVYPTSIHLRPDQYSTSNSGVLVHHYCPLDYCSQELPYIDLSTPDEQCQYNRSGILCGQCTSNKSTVFGSSRCMECSNYWAFLIVPITLVAGILLVVLLTVLNLTVSAGTINALIFYVNIVRANQSVFFSSETNSFCSWFIAWLNLDIGLEVCFYSNMDTYTKTWLQFIFPLYVWFLVTLMITCSHYSTRASRLTANNAVQVLATLFLLSYTTLLRITIVSLSFTTLQYPNGHVERVWLYDGNVQYMRGRHLVLFIAALAVLIFLAVPYTLLIFFIQWLQRYTHYTALRWVTRLKPIFDAYTGPYKNKHRYWTGLLLLLRVLLYLVFSLNVQGDPTTNLLAIVTTVLCLLTYSAYLGGVYRKWPLDLLENTFHLNLGVCSLATLYTYAIDGDHTQVVLTSTSMVFTTLLIISLYHIYLRLSNSALVLKIKKLMSLPREETESLDSREYKTASAPTTSVVELQEPLLD